VDNRTHIIRVSTFNFELGANPGFHRRTEEHLNKRQQSKRRKGGSSFLPYHPTSFGAGVSLSVDPTSANTRTPAFSPLTNSEKNRRKFEQKATKQTKRGGRAWDPTSFSAEGGCAGKLLKGLFRKPDPILPLFSSFPSVQTLFKPSVNSRPAGCRPAWKLLKGPSRKPNPNYLCFLRFLLFKSSSNLLLIPGLPDVDPHGNCSKAYPENPTQFYLCFLRFLLFKSSSNLLLIPGLPDVHPQILFEPSVTLQTFCNFVTFGS
jgi:hypothetical protein